MRKLELINNSSELLNKHQIDKIIFVPTMGSLHAGHLALIEKANQIAQKIANAKVCVSIYVNPLQFAPNEDYQEYPRNLDADLEKLQGLADTCFVPNDQEMYPEQQEIFITAPKLGQELCGKFRPNFFSGVLTVVYKLFTLVKPTIAIFGEKDYQQLILIKKLIKQLSINCEIQAVPTIRDENNLALSSRNQYLSPEEISLAKNFYLQLKQCAQMISEGIEMKKASSEVQSNLSKLNIKVDYIEARKLNLTNNINDLNNFIVLGAIHVGNTRLIDNYIVRS